MIHLVDEEEMTPEAQLFPFLRSFESQVKEFGRYVEVGGESRLFSRSMAGFK